MTSFDGQDGLDRYAGGDGRPPSYGNSSWTANVPNPISPASGGSGYNAYGPYGQPPRKRGLWWWLLIVGVQVVVVGGVTAYSHFETQRITALTEVIPTPSETATADAPLLVTYEVKASGRHNIGLLSYAGKDGAIVNRSDVPLPWHFSFAVNADHRPFLLNVRRTAGGDAGSMTCTITIDDKVVSTTTATGRYASVLCNGS